MFSSLSATQWNFIDWADKMADIFIEYTAGIPVSVSTYAAQYAAVQTNYVLMFAGILGIIVLALKGMSFKKWWWYAFFFVTATCAITSVVMHDAVYDEFQPGVLTTKLIGSYIDMSFTFAMAYTAIMCFVMEFTGKKMRKWGGLAITAFFIYALVFLTIEVWVFHDRPLYFSAVKGATMGGNDPGMSMAEFNCLLLALPILPIFFMSFKVFTKNEKRMLALTIGWFLLGLLMSNIFGDNAVAPILGGAIHPHSWWHMSAAIGTVSLIFLAQERIGATNPRENCNWLETPKPVTDDACECASAEAEAPVVVDEVAEDESEKVEA